MSRSSSSNSSNDRHDPHGFIDIEFHKGIVPVQITWSESSFKSYNATLYVAIKPKAIDEIKEKVQFVKNEISVMIAKNPFENGGKFYVYAAIFNDTSTGARLKYVAKESFFTDSHSNSFEYYEEIVKENRNASYLADEFSKISPSNKSLKFLDASII